MIWSSVPQLAPRIRPGAAVSVNSVVYTGNTPAARVWEIMGFKGDMNNDGLVNGADIDPFFLALGDPAAYLLQFPNCDPLNGDMNGDGRLDGSDIDPFFACLGGGPCP